MGYSGQPLTKTELVHRRHCFAGVSDGGSYATVSRPPEALASAATAPSDGLTLPFNVLLTLPAVMLPARSAISV